MLAGMVVGTQAQLSLNMCSVTNHTRPLMAWCMLSKLHETVVPILSESTTVKMGWNVS